MESARLKSQAFVERIATLSIPLGLLLIHLFAVHKLAFVGFYYLPIVLAGYFCGKRTTLLLSVLAVFLVVLYSLVQPGKMWPNILRKQVELAALEPRSSERENVLDDMAREKLKLHLSLVVWGSFLVLAAITSSALYDQKQRKIQELRRAYTGLVEMLTKYLELADRQLVGRSMKVAELAAAVAKRMNLGEEAIENTRIAALLHDLGHKEISALILEKSGELGRESGAKIRTRGISGQEVLRSVSSVVEGVLPILNAYHKRFVVEEDRLASGPATREAQIIAAARSYYDMVTGDRKRKPRPPQEALEEIRSSAGTEFSPKIIEAFEKTLQEGGG